MKSSNIAALMTLGGRDWDAAVRKVAELWTRSFIGS